MFTSSSAGSRERVWFLVRFSTREDCTLFVKMTMRRLRRRLTIAIGQKSTSVPCAAAVKLVLPEKFPYNRPWFLGLDPDHSVVSGDHNTRMIISARDSDNLPCRAGYAEYELSFKVYLKLLNAHIVCYANYRQQ